MTSKCHKFFHITYRPIRKWSHMPTPNANMVPINTSTQGHYKQSALHKRKWPGHFWLLLTPYKSLKPWGCLGLFWVYNIIPHPFFTSPISINCQIHREETPYSLNVIHKVERMERKEKKTNHTISQTTTWYICLVPKIGIRLYFNPWN